MRARTARKSEGQIEDEDGTDGTWTGRGSHAPSFFGSSGPTNEGNFDLRTLKTPGAGRGRGLSFVCGPRQKTKGSPMSGTWLPFFYGPGQARKSRWSGRGPRSERADPARGRGLLSGFAPGRKGVRSPDTRNTGRRTRTRTSLHAWARASRITKDDPDTQTDGLRTRGRDGRTRPKGRTPLRLVGPGRARKTKMGPSRSPLRSVGRQSNGSKLRKSAPRLPRSSTPSTASSARTTISARRPSINRACGSRTASGPT